MKWIAISGSWRHTPQALIKDLHREMDHIVKTQDGVVTGGALGVDYLATAIFLEKKLVNRLKIFLPTTLEKYKQHYLQRADQGVITHQQAEDLLVQLYQVQQLSKDSLIEDLLEPLVNQKSYYQRITKIVEAADELIAFQVNKSEGTQDTINKAKQKGIKIKVYEYEV